MPLARTAFLPRRRPYVRFDQKEDDNMHFCFCQTTVDQYRPADLGAEAPDVPDLSRSLTAVPIGRELGFAASFEAIRPGQ
jgi:hypothetical protein